MLATYESVAMGSVAGITPAFGDADPLGVKNFFSGAFKGLENIRHGVILAYNPNTHSANVLVFGTQSVWPCVFADEPLSYAYGFSSSHPAREGEMVLVAQVSRWSNAGIVIGRLGYTLCFAKGDKYNDPDQLHRRIYTQDDLAKETWDRHVEGMMKALGNENDPSTHIATHFRPTDVYPGEFAHVNQHNCGIKGGLFSSTLLGGGASLRLSAITNAARLACEHYLRHTLHGTTHEFHNGRYLSSERNYALYQEERLGGNAPQAKVWTDDSEAPVGGEDQTLRPRMKDLTGFFGHLSSKFCFRPDPDEGGEPRVQGEGAPREAGVSRVTIDPSGQYRMSAAGMITIERTGRIPVPVRNCYPTDPDHDISSDPEKLKPFKHKDEEDPSYRQLELFDRQAYDLKNQYARVDGLGTDYPDYDVPQEDELQPLKDQYDEKFFGNETVRLEKFDKRRAGVYVGEDGSVIVRDAWGSEIVMLGGNIQLSCAGNVMIMPGKTALTIAGDDIVQKAQNSVDIHASAHDVRLSAAHNMEILGGGDESSNSGGVIIESRGHGVAPWDGKDSGEAARLSGITLKTNNQAVVIAAEEVNVRSKSQTRIVSGDKDIDGRIDIGAKMVRARAKTIYMASDDAAIAVNKGSFSAIGKSIGIYGKNGLTLTKGSKTPIPIKWEDIGQNVAANYLPKFAEATNDLADEETATGAFNMEALEKMMFGFRTSQECGAEEPWVIGGKGGFKLYEPAWAQILEIYDTMRGIQKDVYKEDAAWENGKPWPGKEAEESAMYAQLNGLKPKNLTGEGFNKSREEVEDSSDVTEVPLKGNYIVRKTQ